MSYKWIGAVFIILACGGFGILLAANHRREERTLRQLICALDLMACELQYRLTPLPDLCRQAGQESRGCVGEVLRRLSDELDSQVAPEVGSCMSAALGAVKDIPSKTEAAFRQMGRSLGRFDLPGQMKGLEALRADCRRELDALSQNKDTRLRSYQTLGFCAGAALAILFL